MKKIILLVLVMALLLTGCVSDFVVETDETDKRQWEGSDDKEFVYEFTARNNAYMYNNGITKLLAYTSTREAFTYFVPKFHTYSQIQLNRDYPTDAYLRLSTASNAYDDKGVLVDSLKTYEFMFMTREEFEQYGKCLLYHEMLKTVKPISSYPTSDYASYDDYVAAFEDSLNAWMRSTTHQTPALFMNGAEQDINAYGSRIIVTHEETEYLLPTATYYFGLPTGNYMVLTLRVFEPEYADLLFSDFYKDGLSKQVVQQLQSSAECTFDFDAKALELCDYVLYGDFSEFFKKSNDTTVWDRLSIEDSLENKQKEAEFVEDEDTEDEASDFTEGATPQVQPTQAPTEEEPQQLQPDTENFITAPSDNDIGNTYDYGTEVQGYFDPE